MVHHTIRKLRGLPVRVVGFVNQPTRIVAALLTLAVLCAVFDVISNSQQSEPATEPQLVVATRAAELDDPVGFRTFSLQQQGYSGSAEAVGHRSSGKSRLSSKTGHICENTCFKVRFTPDCSCSLHRQEWAHRNQGFPETVHVMHGGSVRPLALSTSAAGFYGLKKSRRGASAAAAMVKRGCHYSCVHTCSASYRPTMVCVTKAAGAT